MRAQLIPLLKALRLHGMAEVLDRELDQAERQGWPPDQVLHRLLQEASRHRQERSLVQRLGQARLPWSGTLESFPFALQPNVNRAQIYSLAGLAFVERAEKVVFIGPPGTGKTGLACALLRQACVNGYRGRFYNAQDLLDELYASLADRSTARLLNRLANYDVLLIDELGYLNLKSEQVNAFFKLMELRYERHSTLSTTNLDYPHWYALFQRKPLVDALLDRLQHYCITLRIDGPSLRVPESTSAPAPERREGQPPLTRANRASRIRFQPSRYDASPSLALPRLF